MNENESNDLSFSMDDFDDVARARVFGCFESSDDHSDFSGEFESELDDPFVVNHVDPMPGGGKVLRYSGSCSREVIEYEVDRSAERELDVSVIDDTSYRSIVIGLRASTSAGLVNAPVQRYYGESLCTEDSLAAMFDKCQVPEGLLVKVPKSHQRPWTPPKGCICVYEPYFTEGGLWFPLPKFLSCYGARRKIALSQLTVNAIRNAVGLTILGAECGIEVDVDLLEAATKFSVTSNNPGLCSADAKRNHTVYKGAENKFHEWRRRYFYLKLNEISIEGPASSYITKWNMFPVPVVRSRLRSTNLASNLKQIFAKDTLLWPNVLEHYRICSPSCLRMGKANCQFPNYADEFRVGVTEPSDDVTQHEVSGLARGPVFRVPADVNVSA